MIADCITFYNGLDVLEIRLNTLEDYVDRFVIVESPFDMTGKPKRLYLNENKDRFKQFNIIYLVVGDHEKHMKGIWEPYYYQIDYAVNGLLNLSGDDIVMISDFDEIPNLESYSGAEGSFRQELYYYYLNVITSLTNWRGTVAVKMKNMVSLSRLRRRRTRVPIIGNGWHFSYISTEQEIIEKIEAFCHYELNTKIIKNQIGNNLKELKDPFGRNIVLRVQQPSGPQWLLDNRDKYKNLFYEEKRNGCR